MIRFLLQDAVARPAGHRATSVHVASRPAMLRPLGWLLAAGLALGLAQGTATAQAAGPTGQVFTADERGASITRIDLAAGQSTILPLSIAPHNAQVSADGRLRMAVGEPVTDGHAHGGGNGHPHGDEPGELQLFGVDDVEAGPLASIAVGSHPAHVVSDPDGRYAFVTNAGDDSVSVVDLTAREEVATIATGRYPHGLRLSPDGTELYVANVLDDSVSVIGLEAREELARIPVGKAPVQVGFTPNGERVFVSLRDENRVAVIDTASREVIARVQVGRLPIQVHASPDGRLVHVANEGSREAPDNRVSIIDTATLEVIATHEVGPGAHGVSVDDGGTVPTHRIRLPHVHTKPESLPDLRSVRRYGSGSGSHSTSIALAVLLKCLCIRLVVALTIDAGTLAGSC